MIIETLCKIPESVGWFAVGAASMLLAVLLIAVGKTVYRAIKMRMEDDEEVEF